MTVDFLDNPKHHFMKKKKKEYNQPKPLSWGDDKIKRIGVLCYKEEEVQKIYSSFLKTILFNATHRSRSRFKLRRK